MTIRDLKDIIDSVEPEKLDEKVYLIEQPQWPFVYDLEDAGYISEKEFESRFIEECKEEGLDPEGFNTKDPDPEYCGFDCRPGLYLAEGTQLAYARTTELEHFGWR